MSDPQKLTQGTWRLGEGARELSEGQISVTSFYGECPKKFEKFFRYGAVSSTRLALRSEAYELKESA